jgi:transcriptional regulator with XRE-family HTH domain
MSGEVSWEAFGHRIREGRLARGLSMRALAREVGISAPYVNELERGRSRPGLDVVARLADALRLPFVELATLVEYRLPSWMRDVNMPDREGSDPPAVNTP